jgi:NADH:ubiquinone oxidoreductase subunit E
MVINVCVGSSCHLKGSYEVVETLKRLIAEQNLEDKIELKASFCLGNCSNGVSMKVDDEFVQNANPENIEQIFNEQIKTKL